MTTFAQCHDDIFAEMKQYSSDPGGTPVLINGGFSGVVTKHMAYLSDGLGVRVELCPLRLKSAHNLWLKDLKRVSENDMGNGNLDHFKHAGYLAFWIRRASPLIRIDFEEEAFEKLSEGDQYYVDFLTQFGNEHLAFTLGYEICLFFECYKISAPKDPKAFGFDSPFAHDINSTLKRKNMSPHALNLIYRALFMR